MTSFRKRIAAAAALAVALVMLAGIGVFAAGSTAKISGYTAPSTLKQGSPFYLKGTISATAKIRRVEIGVVDANRNKWTAQKYDNKKVNSRSFNIAKADPYIKFGKLPAGVYRYRIYAHTTDGKVHIVLNHKFYVEKNGTSATPVISGQNLPGNFAAGTPFGIGGAISCGVNITRVEIGVVNADINRWTAQKYDHRVNAKTFNIAGAAPEVRFDRLPAGTYRYRIYAHTANGAMLLLNHKFIVSAAQSTAASAPAQTNTGSATPVISGQNLPGDCTAGTAFNIGGTISCGINMTRVEIGIVDAEANRWTSQKYDQKINAASFNIANAASAVRFDHVPAGTYRYRIYAHTANGATLLLNHKFVVRAAEAPSTTGNTAADGVSFTGYNLPGTYSVGANFSPKGIITADSNISRIEVGIIFAPTNKWTEYKYDKAVNSRSFNLANAASALKFNKLPGGIYRYRIYAHTAKGVVIVLNHRFEVKPSAKPQMATNWAKTIANDNSFAYGKSPETNDIGCYFCGTNQKNKPKGYEKTYVCLTFVGAAYAHGAKDPVILDRCQRGKMTMYENDSNFTRFDCWMKIGSCKDLSVEDLQVGDVIIQWADDNGSGHVAMYAGNNSLVEAHTPGWGAGTISVNTGCAERRLRSLSGNKLNYVMRYRY